MAFSLFKGMHKKFMKTDSSAKCVVEEKEENLERNVEFARHSTSTINLDLPTPSTCSSAPFVGQTFISLEEACMFYRLYERSNGYEVKIRSTHKSTLRKDFITSRMYSCRKSGKPETVLSNDDYEVGMKKRNRDSMEKTNCKARMFVVFRENDSIWEITSLHLEHNHIGVSPGKIKMLQRELFVDEVSKSVIESFATAGIAPSQTMRYLSNIGGGLENVGFGKRQLLNIIRDSRNKELDSEDAHEGIELLKRLQSESVDRYFWQAAVDGENRIKCILWVDSRSIFSYKSFSDVISFDSTYRTNKYGLPFVPITGVNHHYQSILLGFALISDETEETYKWVLRTWLEAMEQKQPGTIITDQDRAMANAIAVVLPNSRHLLCTWHISQKFPERLASLYSQFPDTFKSDFNYCLYKCLSPLEFEDRWPKFLEKYNLESNSWLQQMYSLRTCWIRAYTKGGFAAGMTTTSRSESMNAVFDHYVHKSMGIHAFIKGCQDALERQFMHEKEGDHETVHKSRQMKTCYPMEQHAASVYTKVMFHKFQTELLKSGAWSIRRLPELDCNGLKFYGLLKPSVPAELRRHFVVGFNGTLQTAYCNCQKWEHLGILCRHILRLFTKKSFDLIPAHYIMQRWTVNGNRVDGRTPYGLRHNDVADLTSSRVHRFNALLHNMHGLAASGSCTYERYTFLDEAIGDLGKKVDNMSMGEPTDNLTEESRTNIGTECVYLNPTIASTKGRTKEPRIKSSIELATGVKQHRKCSVCNEHANHNARTCPHRI